ncbi:MAG: SGNH/GDSL hydrolase family protein [archaeon]|nr:SGNH/GDSL hydrolase family protein [archaeon]
MLPASSSSSSSPEILWQALPNKAIQVQGSCAATSGFGRAPLGVSAPGFLLEALDGSSSGLYLEFSTDSSALYLNYSLLHPIATSSSAVSPNGHSGVDLYALDPSSSSSSSSSSQWRWIATSYSGVGQNPDILIPLLAWTDGWPSGPIPSEPSLPRSHSYRLHLPTLNAVTLLSVGVSVGSLPLAPISARVSPSSPLLFFGCSSVLGSIVARPGQALVSRLSRLLDRQVVNLGCENEACQLSDAAAAVLVAAAVSSNASVLLLDVGWALPATSSEMIVRAVESIKAAVPALALVLLEPTAFMPSWILGDVHHLASRTAAIVEAYLQLSFRYPTVYFIPLALLAPSPGPFRHLDPTFDGRRLTDEGHKNYAIHLASILNSLKSFSPSSSLSISSSISSISLSSSSISLPSPISSSLNRWYPATDFFITGRAFPASSLPNPWARLPTSAQNVVRAEVWNLSLNSAGLAVAFSTNSSTIVVNYTAQAVFSPMVHFSVSGISGLDLFAFDDNSNKNHNASGVLRFVGTLPLPQSGNKIIASFSDFPFLPSTTPRRFVVYCPTYNAPAELLLGFDADAVVTPFAPFPQRFHKPPIVWYGTSITQGAVASRPSNIFTSIVSRELGREVFNFGFSGNGKMEISVAQFLVQIDNPIPAAFVIDCNHNMNASEILQAAVPLVKYLRTHRPSVPIVLVEGTPFGRDWAISASMASQTASNAALQLSYRLLLDQGFQQLFLVNSSVLFQGIDLIDSPTAMGLHPSDSGMHDIAKFWVPFFQNLFS